MRQSMMVLVIAILPGCDNPEESGSGAPPIAAPPPRPTAKVKPNNAEASEAIENAIRSDLKKWEGKITWLDRRRVEWLSLHKNQISDLNPLAQMPNVDWAMLAENQITDLAPLARLTKLNWLNLSGNQITDLAPLAGLTKLKRLWLGYNQVTDLKPLAALTKLLELNLVENKITDLTPLAGMTRLRVLFLSENQVTNLKPLAKLTSLQSLHLENNPQLIRAEIDWLQNQLPACEIHHSATD